jgi:putrescine carbamoyltransferase
MLRKEEAMASSKDFIDTQDLSQSEILDLIDLGILLKRSVQAGYYPKLLRDKVLGMIFEQTSTRTRVSFETAINQLGGAALYLAPGQIQLGAHEGVVDTAKVLDRMIDGLEARVDSHESIITLAENTHIPIFNGMSDYNHPTQEIGDITTMFEHFEPGMDWSQVKVTFVGDRTQVCSSLAMVITHLGGNFVHYGPAGYQLEPNIQNIANDNVEAYGGSFTVTDRAEAALAGADFVYTDVWYGLYNEERTKEQYMDIFYPKFQVTKEIMALAKPTAKFMHCLPANRGEEVAAEVIDGPQSIVFEQSENRLTAQRALLVTFMRGQKPFNASEAEACRKLIEARYGKVAD